MQTHPQVEGSRKVVEVALYEGWCGWNFGGGGWNCGGCGVLCICGVVGRCRVVCCCRVINDCGVVGGYGGNFGKIRDG